jgi:hypothetical protein
MTQFYRLTCDLNVASGIDEIYGDETNYSQWWFHVLFSTLEMSWHSFMVMKLISPIS